MQILERPRPTESELELWDREFRRLERAIRRIDAGSRREASAELERALEAFQLRATAVQEARAREQAGGAA